MKIYHNYYTIKDQQWIYHREFITKWSSSFKYKEKIYVRNNFLVYFRYDPIPYTGKKYIWSFARYYKNPKTIQEKRMSFSCESKYIRKKRSVRMLPCTWDDNPRSDIKVKKSWKKKKIKKQYMKHWI